MTCPVFAWEIAMAHARGKAKWDRSKKVRAAAEEEIKRLEANKPSLELRQGYSAVQAAYALVVEREYAPLFGVRGPDID